MKKVLSGIILAMLLASLFGFGLNVGQFTRVAGEFSTDEHTLALWHFNEGEGQNVYDSSSHGNDGILGPTANVEDRDPSWTTGLTGKSWDYALSFDEWWDYVYVPDNPDDSLDLLGGDQFTIEFWTYVRQISRSDRGSGIHWNAFINKWQAGAIGGYEMAQCLQVPPPPLFDAWFYNSTGVPLHAGCDPTPTYEWVHVMFTYDGQYSRIYFDGVLQNETDVGHEYVAGNDLPLTIGKNLESDEPWNDAADCIIDEVRISSIVRGQATTLEVVNAEYGTHNFTFYTNTTVFGDTFVVNITVKDVTDLWNWEYKLGWDPTVLEAANVSLPADHVFSYPINVLNYTMVQGGPTIDNAAGTVHHGLTYLMGPTFWVFNGTGTLAQITFRIKKGVDQNNTQVSSNLAFLNQPLETFLLNYDLEDISFTIVDGYYEFNYVVPTLEIVNAVDGTHEFVFYTNTTTVGSTFVVNITVVGAVDLFLWQIKIAFDPTALNCYDAWLPADHVFAGKSQFNVMPVIDNTAGTLLYGNTLEPSEEAGVNVTEGRLAQIGFTIVRGPDYLDPQISAGLTLVNPQGDTFLLDHMGLDIIFIAVNGYYEFNATLSLPYLEVRPSFIEGQEIGTPFAVEIWVRNLDAGWALVGIQFALLYNTTLLQFADATNGTWIRGFEDGEEVAGYWISNIDDYPNPDIKGVVGGVMILPELGGTWVAPFPSGDGLLMTLWFNPVYETIFPDIAEMPLEFRGVYLDWMWKCEKALHWDPILFLTMYGDEIRFQAPVQGLYRAPQVYADIAITDLVTSKSGGLPMPIVCEGFSAKVNATVVNHGEDPKTFNVTAYANATIIGIQTVNNLGPGEQITLTFTWNTTGWDRGNYTISAYAWLLPGEVNPDDNTFEDDVVKVTIVGDVQGDGKVDMRDIGNAARAFDARPESPNWDPNADINEDGIINMRDIGIVARHFGEQE